MKFSTFKFGSEEVCVCIKNQEVWFMAAAVTKILGYRKDCEHDIIRLAEVSV